MSSGGLRAGEGSTESALGFSYMWNGGYVGGTFLGPWGLLELLRLPIVTVAWDLDSVARWDADGSDLIVFCGWSIARYVQTPDFVLDHVAQRQDRSARDGFKMQMGSRCRWVQDADGAPPKGGSLPPQQVGFHSLGSSLATRRGTRAVVRAAHVPCPAKCDQDQAQRFIYTRV
jgi:hypothetical protein